MRAEGAGPVDVIEALPQGTPRGTSEEVRGGAVREQVSPHWVTHWVTAQKRRLRDFSRNRL